MPCGLLHWTQTTLVKCLRAHLYAKGAAVLWKALKAAPWFGGWGTFSERWPLLLACGVGLRVAVFFQLDVAAGTAFTRQSPPELLARHRGLEALEPAAVDGGEGVRPPPAVLTASSLSAAEAAQANAQWPLLRVYGVTEQGASVMANVYGFFPYCLCEVPRQLWKPLAALKASKADSAWQVNELTEQLSTLVEVRRCGGLRPSGSCLSSPVAKIGVGPDWLLSPGPRAQDSRAKQRLRPARPRRSRGGERGKRRCCQCQSRAP